MSEEIIRDMNILRRYEREGTATWNQVLYVVKRIERTQQVQIRYISRCEGISAVRKSKKEYLEALSEINRLIKTMGTKGEIK